MKTINYNLLCEGYSEHYSLPKLLEEFGKQEAFIFKRSKLRIKNSSSPSKSKVIQKTAEFATETLVVENLDLFIVGVDLDQPDFSDETPIWQKQHDELLTSIDKQLRDKVVIFVSIQAFDYWLLYQKYKIDNSQKPIANSLESRSKNDIKKSLYGKSFPSEYEIKKICELISSKIDIKELQTQSKSFNKFISSLNTILK